MRARVTAVFGVNAGMKMAPVLYERSIAFNSSTQHSRSAEHRTTNYSYRRTSLFVHEWQWQVPKLPA